MAQETSELERRLSELQSQIDRLSMALHLWRERQDHLQPLEVRLAQLTDRCTEIVNHWETTGERHAQAVGELEQRLAGWGPEGAMGVSHGTLDRTEARLAGIETNLNRRLTDLTDQVQAALAELRSHGAHPPATPASWPLDNVVRLHNQLREADGPPSPSASLEAINRPQLPEPATLARNVVENGARTRHAGGQESALERRNWLGRLAWAAVVGVALVFGVAGIVLSRDAGRQAQAATAAANQQIAAARQEAGEEIAEARETALKAQTVSDVLAAPDLLRLTLIGRNRLTTAQVLLSRTRGLVISGSRIPPPPAGSAYQVWLLTPEEPISAGVITPDSAGRVTLVTDMPPRVPPPIGGASITIEPVGGSQLPTGPVVMSRPQN